MSHYTKTCMELDYAAAEGIISPEQAAALKQRFAQKQGFFSKLTLAQWLAAAGGLFIALGIILIIAFNWKYFGDIIKISGFILMLAGIGWGCLKADGKPALQTTLGIIWFFMPAAGIGLYAQTFQLSGSPLAPYILWAILVAPLAVFFESRLYSRLLSALLFAILFYGTFSSNTFMSLEMSNWAQLPMLDKTVHWLGALTVLALSLGINFYKKDRWSPPVAAALLWLSMLMIADHSSLRTGSIELNTAAGMACAVIFFVYKKIIAEKAENIITGIINNGFRIWVFFLYTLTMLHGHNYHSYSYYRMQKLQEPGIGPYLALLMLAASIWLAIKIKFIPENQKADNGIKTMLILSIICPLMPMITCAPNWNSCAILSNLLLLGIGIWLLWLGSEYGSRKALNNGMAIIAITAITRFIDIFGSQLTSGMAFIVTGAIFTFLAWWFRRGLKKMSEPANHGYVSGKISKEAKAEPASYSANASEKSIGINAESKLTSNETIDKSVENNISAADKNISNNANENENKNGNENGEIK
ncbi:MAG: DUF2157 domain-containing protein [Elusimicrobiales bacterium]|nr:DUF2157 domain-containing protein [Elusimicrobiales bacterium]